MPKLFGQFSTSILPATVRTRLERLYAKWQEARLDGKVTVQEFVTFVQSGIREAMEAVKDLSDDAVKKAVVMEFAGLLFDFFLPYIKQTWLGWFLSFFGDDTLKQRYLDAVSLSIEMLYHDYFAPKLAA